MQSIEFTTKHQTAQFWKRCVAYGIDSIIINFIILMPFKNIFSETSTGYANLLAQSLSRNIAIASFTISILTLVYWIAFEWKLGQTPGKLIMSLYIASKTPITLNQVITRNLSKPFIIVLILDVAYMFFKKDNQRLLERFSNTFVLERTLVIKTNNNKEQNQEQVKEENNKGNRETNKEQQK